MWYSLNTGDAYICDADSEGKRLTEVMTDYTVRLECVYAFYTLDVENCVMGYQWVAVEGAQ